MGAQAVKSQLVCFDVPCTDLDRAIGFCSGVLGGSIPKRNGPGFSMGILRALVRDREGKRAALHSM